MEALSIQAVKANTRPAGTQAQDELGDIFQALLRNSVELQEMPVLLPRADDRPARDAPRRSLPDDRVGVASGDRRDRPADRDADYRAYDAPAAAESRPAPSPSSAPTNDTAREREVAVNTKARQSSASDQPSVNRDAQEATPANDSVTPTSDGVQKVEEQTTAVSGNRVVILDPARPNAIGQGVVASIADASGQANPAAILPAAGASGKAAAAAAANQTQNPASSQPSVPGTGTAATPASAGGNGFSA